MEQQQQQPQLALHRAVAEAIARDPRRPRTKRQDLIVFDLKHSQEPPIDRRSFQHLIDFINNSNNGADRGDGDDDDDDDTHEAKVEITKLQLNCVRLSQHPSDGGFNVLRDFFARSDTTTLTRIELHICFFGTAEDAAQLLAAFQTNRSVTDLSIRFILKLSGATLGSCLSTLMQNMPQLQRLICSHD
jgi:hypothetical protein